MVKFCYAILLLALSISAYSQSASIEKSDTVNYKAYLVLRNGGYRFLDLSFTRLHVLGSISLDNNGLKFTPDSVFKSTSHTKVFRFNHLVKEISIPYSNIMEIKLSVFYEALFPVKWPVIITKNGVKYRLYIDRYKTFKKQMQKKISN